MISKKIWLVMIWSATGNFMLHSSGQDNYELTPARDLEQADPQAVRVDMFTQSAELADQARAYLHRQQCPLTCDDVMTCCGNADSDTCLKTTGAVVGILGAIALIVGCLENKYEYTVYGRDKFPIQLEYQPGCSVKSGKRTRTVNCYRTVYPNEYIKIYNDGGALTKLCATNSESNEDDFLNRDQGCVTQKGLQSHKDSTWYVHAEDSGYVFTRGNGEKHSLKNVTQEERDSQKALEIMFIDEALLRQQLYEKEIADKDKNFLKKN